jgi:hypothetical protein
MNTTEILAITIIISLTLTLIISRKHNTKNSNAMSLTYKDPLKYAGCCVRGDCPWQSKKDVQIPANVKICTTVNNTRDEMINKVSQHFGHDPSHLESTPHDILRAAFLKAAVWPQGTVLNVGFIKDGNFTEEKANWVEKCVTEKLQPLIGLKFTFDQPTDKCQIRITFDPKKGAWSMVGTEALDSSPPEPTMNLGWLDGEQDFDFPQAKGTGAVVIHEFGHAIGMVHEHSRQDAALPWNCSLVYSYLGGPPNNWDKATIDSNVLNPIPQGQLDGSPYDPYSIMHYYFQKEFFVEDIELPHVTELSDQDREWISKMYPPKKGDPGKGNKTRPEKEPEPKENHKLLIQSGIILCIFLTGLLTYKILTKHKRKSKKH